VFSHEFIHALLSATLQLENKGEWFQEGLASHYQLRFHPQANIRSVVSDSLKAADADTLKKVCSGARIPLDRYWVAGTLCRMLLADPALAAKLPAVVAAMQKSGSTALEPLLPQLGLSWEELDERWRTFCRQNYGDRATRATGVPITPRCVSAPWVEPSGTLADRYRSGSSAACCAAVNPAFKLASRSAWAGSFDRSSISSASRATSKSWNRPTCG
jgi:hypothetical protein